MPELTPIVSGTPWLRLDVTDEDWAADDPRALRRTMEQMFVVRRFEQKLLELWQQGMLNGPAHASIGQEACGVGATSMLRSCDWINGTHRAHHQFLSKFLNHATPPDYDPADGEWTEAMDDMVYRSMAEIMGLAPGFCGGRGGSMHMRFDDAGMMGSNAIVGGNPPLACGHALAAKQLGEDRITVTFFGDGAVQQGASYEALNLAALYELPLIFFNENNLYGVSTHVSEATRETRLSARGQGVGVPSLEIDGMNALAVRKAMDWAIRHIRESGGPVLIEALTYRFHHQHGPLLGSNFDYRTKEEEAKWRERDPVIRHPEKLIAMGLVKKERAEELMERAGEIVDRCAGRLTETAPGSNEPQVIPALWPNPTGVEDGIRGDLSELDGATYREVEDVPTSEMRTVKYIEAVALAAKRHIEADERVIIMGEDVHRLRGGVIGAVKGIAEEHAERLMAMPISENGFTGMGLGAAMCGLRPIVEIMYADFSLVAADQLFNQAAKLRHMFGGKYPAPLVVRMRSAPGIGFGSQHSMDPSGLFSMWPGWRIVAPTTPYDYIGLFNAAMACNDPVAIIEVQPLFQQEGPIPDDLDYMIPFGKAKIVRPGSECTVIACSNMVPVSVEAAASTGIDAEVIDLRTLDVPSRDWETISHSVRRTHRVLIVEQTARGYTIGNRLAADLQERLFDELDHEIIRVSGTESAPTVSRVLEAAALANIDDVVTGLHQVMGGTA
jgi:2-oxoisovalerate dehydrogenase E1 component